MVAPEHAQIEKIILHRIRPQETSLFSENEFDYTGEEEEMLLKKIFLKPFSAMAVTSEFTHEVNIDYNVLFKISKAILEEGDFVANSKDIGRHLMSASIHPGIKDGDLFIVKFNDLQFENKYFQALGIYKFEDKDSFIDASVKNGQAQFKLRKGIGTRKPDKACLILFTEEPYTLFILDNHTDTDYWQKTFINHRFKDDHINKTTDFLNLAKNYITGGIDENFEISKADKIDLLNRSVDYFKRNETFQKDDFESQVFFDTDVIASFRKYEENFGREHQMAFTDHFEISGQAVKKQARHFKSVLKLDRNFHIYIHGNRDLIQQGTDKDGRKYYKIYFEEES